MVFLHLNKSKQIYMNYAIIYSTTNSVEHSVLVHNE